LLSDFFKSKTFIGRKYENKACLYLEKKGFHLLVKNFYSKYGEIDLIMQDRQQLVFVECRYRKKTNFGKAIESINQKKIRKIKKTALYYLQKTQNNDTNCRFDVVTFDNENITHIKSAF
jgi:putative endonuclease